MNKTKTVMTFEEAVCRLSNKQKDFFFIQAGACDGHMADPIRRFIRPYEWKGIFLEPYKFYMKALENKYKDIKDRFVFENSAISTETSEKMFHNIKPEYVNPIIVSITMVHGDVAITTGIDLKTASPEQLHEWSALAPCWNSLDHLRGQGSFYKGKVLSSIAHMKNKDRRARDVFKDFDMNPEKYVDSSLVKCKTINNLIEENNIKKIDLLTTDIQGYDIKLLLTLDRFLIKPKIVYFESHMIEDEEEAMLSKIFRKNGYIKGFTGDAPDSFYYLPDEILV